MGTLDLPSLPCGWATSGEHLMSLDPRFPLLTERLSLILAVVKLTGNSMACGQHGSSPVQVTLYPVVVSYPQQFSWGNSERS